MSVQLIIFCSTVFAFCKRMSSIFAWFKISSNLTWRELLFSPEIFILWCLNIPALPGRFSHHLHRPNHPSFHPTPPSPPALSTFLHHFYMSRQHSILSGIEYLQPKNENFYLLLDCSTEIVPLFCWNSRFSVQINISRHSLQKAISAKRLFDLDSFDGKWYLFNSKFFLCSAGCKMYFRFPAFKTLLTIKI